VAHRPLTAEEREYLHLLKGALDQGLQGTAISAGLIALPLFFLASTFSPHKPIGDIVVTVLATAILAGFMWAVLSYTAKGGRGRALRKGDLKLRGLIGEDLIARGVLGIEDSVGGKVDEFVLGPLQRNPERGTPRRFYLSVRGKRYEVTASRWLGTRVGDHISLEVAERSGTVLTIDGMRDRLPIGDLARGDNEDALGIPFKPGGR
jgi:hypothetical protein